MGMQDRRVAARKRAEQGIFFPWDKGRGRRQRKAKTGGWILKLTSEGDTASQGPGAQRSGTRGSEVSQAEASRSQLSLRLRPPEEFKALVSMGLESELGPERLPASSASSWLKKEGSGGLAGCLRDARSMHGFTPPHLWRLILGKHCAWHRRSPLPSPAQLHSRLGSCQLTGPPCGCRAGTKPTSHQQGQDENPLGEPGRAALQTQ